MKTHLNTLFISTEDIWLNKGGAAVVVRHEEQNKLRVPFQNLEGICCFGWNIGASPSLLAACAEAGISVSFHNPHGKLLCISHGFTHGNIHLRREQYRRADDESASLAIARNCISAKLINARTILLRMIRDHGAKSTEITNTLRTAARAIEGSTRECLRVDSLDSLRGIEGDAAARWFSIFPLMFTQKEPMITMNGRSRRPPLDPVNALLSFLYALLAHDCRSALEGCGLDPQCGFLHRDRPGRASLALDLMEEFRPYFADRLALSLFNRQQITAKDFDFTESGAVLLKDDSRKKVLQAWQERKQGETLHPFLQEKCTIGMLPHLQARLLARHIRGDIDAYPAWLSR